MFRIRKKAPQKAPAAPPDMALPRALARGFLLHIRTLHKWKRMFEPIIAAMPAESAAPYEMFAKLELQPDFDGVLRMIDQARVHGVISEDEAANLRTGQKIDIAFPVVEE